MRHRQQVQPVPPPRLRTAGAAPTPPRLLRPDALPALQRLAGNRAATVAVQRADQRTGAFEPDRARQKRLHNELNPTIATADDAEAPPPWDGAARPDGTLPVEAAVARKALLTDLVTAMDRHLAARQPAIDATRKAPKLAMTDFEGAGRGAKRVVDTEFGAWASGSVLTAPQRHVRAGHAFAGSGPGQNLFDSTDPAQRAAAGHPVNPKGMASWIASTDPGAVKAQTFHHFSPLRSEAERDFLIEEVLAPYVAGHDQQLSDYDLYQSNMADPATGRIVAAPQVSDKHSADRPGNGDDPPAERATRWFMWKLLIHEYLHTLQHPTYLAAAGENSVLKEGFCEMFCQEVLFPALDELPAELVDEVEGRHNASPPGRTIAGWYETPEDYRDPLARAVRISDHILGNGNQGSGENAVRAAFFQGHVEFLGLNPDGTGATAPDQDTRDLVTVPAGVTTLAGLAEAARVHQAEIVKANADRGVTVGGTGPLPPRLYVPGCRDHVVVAVTDRARNRAVETKQRIADQNGVSTGALERANPGRDWVGLDSGDRVLVPAH